MINRNIELQEELKNFNKDDEIQRLLSENSRLRRNSIKIMTKKEKEAAELFAKKHYESCNSKLGISYILTGAGMGTTIEVMCNKCGVEEDITDTDSW